MLMVKCDINITNRFNIANLISLPTLLTLSAKILILGENLFVFFWKILMYIHSCPNNIFTKFQPLISKTDTITASKFVSHCTYLRITVFYFWSISFRQAMF